MSLQKGFFAAVLLHLGSAVRASDWPQFMLNSEHNGNAEHEELKLPLGLIAQVKLDDMVTTSPAMVGGLVYVVDQMGTAYCVDPKAGKILWQTSPDGAKAMGSNTSCPCVVNGRMYYGTTAGSFHILNAKDGKVIKTIPMNWPVIAAPVYANDSIYIQTVGAIIHCLDLDGKERWQWDHYKEIPPPDQARSLGHVSGNRPHYGVTEVSVSGKAVVSTLGVDNFCIEDQDTKAKLRWIIRSGRDSGPMNSSIADDYVYTAWCGSDGKGGRLWRFRLDFQKILTDHKEVKTWSSQNVQTGNAVWNTYGVPAVRGQMSFRGSHAAGAVLDIFGDERVESAGFRGAGVLGSPVLSQKHCVYGNVDGAIFVKTIPKDRRAWYQPEVFRFQTPHGKMISASPALSNGQIVFGCDDGYLYVLGPGGTRKPKKEVLTLHEKKSKNKSATAKAYGWPTPYGDFGNTAFVDDPELHPPFKLRWAVRSFCVFKPPLGAIEDALFFYSMEGTVGCMEQATGRIRWRRRLPPAANRGMRHEGVIAEDGRFYVVHRESMFGSSLQKFLKKFLSKRKPFTPETWYCLDLKTGRTLWEKEVGIGSGHVTSVYSDGVVACGSIYFRPEKTRFVSVVEGRDSKTGNKLWEVVFNLEDTKNEFSVSKGCADEHVMYFSAGSSRLPGGGETVAIEAKTGKVIWRVNPYHSRARPVLSNDRLYLSGWHLPYTCLSAKDGKLIWQTKARGTIYGPAVGREIMYGVGRGGKNTALQLSDGKRLDVKLGGLGWTCGPNLLTAGGYSIHATSGGLFLKDIKTGKLVWQSDKGFAIRHCASPAVANGRIFCNPQVSGMIFCFEPEKTRETPQK